MAALDAGSLGALISVFTTDCVHADSMSKQQCMERTIQAFEAGNFDLETDVSLIGMDTPLQTKMSLPKAILVPLQPLLITEAELDINMSVSSHSESSTEVESHSEVQGKASVGFGLFKASMSVKASVGVKSSSRRSSDQRSTCEAKVVMGQGEIPEGVSRILDAILLTVDKGMDMNLKIIEVQANKLAGDIDANGGGDDADADDASDGGFGDDTSADDTGADDGFN